MIESLRSAWRKNAPELIGLSTGATPDFVLARRPVGPLPGVPVFGFHLVQGPSFEADLAFLTENDYTTLGATELVDYLAGLRGLLLGALARTTDESAGGIRVPHQSVE